MKKNFVGVVIASVLSLNAFTASAQKVDYNEWAMAQKGDSMTVLNVNRQNAILSVNCQGGKHTWVSLETYLGHLIYPDPNHKPGEDTLSLELLVTTKEGELVRWTKDDLNFNKPNGAGAQRVQVLFDTLHEAKKVEALLGGEVIIPFEGAPSKAFPKFKEVASFCKS